MGGRSGREDEIRRESVTQDPSGGNRSDDSWLVTKPSIPVVGDNQEDSQFSCPRTAGTQPVHQQSVPWY